MKTAIPLLVLSLGLGTGASVFAQDPIDNNVGVDQEVGIDATPAGDGVPEDLGVTDTGLNDETGLDPADPDQSEPVTDQTPTGVDVTNDPVNPEGRAVNEELGVDQEGVGREGIGVEDTGLNDEVGFDPADPDNLSGEINEFDNNDPVDDDLSQNNDLGLEGTGLEQNAELGFDRDADNFWRNENDTWSDEDVAQFNSDNWGSDNFGNFDEDFVWETEDEEFNNWYEGADEDWMEFNEASDQGWLDV